MIGECGVKPDEFWKLTEAETMAIATGKTFLQNYESANFRNVFYAMIRLWSKEKKPAEKLWPLDIDNFGSSMDIKDRYE